MARKTVYISQGEINGFIKIVFIQGYKALVIG